MKHKINKLVKLSRSVTLSGKHFAVIHDLAERLGCVNLLSPNTGKPTVSLFLEAIAEGRLLIMDGETNRLVNRDKDLADELSTAISNDRASNPFRLESVLTSKSFALKKAKQRREHEKAN